MKFPLFQKKLLLAVQWGSRSVDYIVARTHSGALRIQRSGSLAREGEAGLTAPAELLLAELSDLTAHRIRLLLGVSRSQVDVAYLDLPPATDDELPDLVNHQLLIEAGDNSDQSIVDFLPLNEDPEEPRRVCTVSIEAAIATAMSDECTALAGKPETIGFQPTATAQRFHHLAPRICEPLLLVNLVDRDVDLIVCEGGTVRYTRGFVVSTDDQPEVGAQLAVEIRRTLAVSPVDGKQVGHVYLFGTLEQHDVLVSLLSDSLDLPVSLLNPFESIDLGDTCTPSDVGRFAPLLGMLQDAVSGRQSIDFAHPRKPPQPRSRWRQFAFYVTAASLLLAAIATFLYRDHLATRQALNNLQLRADQFQRRLEKVRAKQVIVDAVARWRSDDVTWLDELRDVSARFPHGSDAAVRKMSLGSSPGGGVLDLKLQVRDPQTIAAMESGLRDPFHQVRSKRISEIADGGDLPWQFETLITLQRRDRPDYLTGLTDSLPPHPATHPPPPDTP